MTSPNPTPSANVFTKQLRFKKKIKKDWIFLMWIIKFCTFFDFLRKVTKDRIFGQWDAAHPRVVCCPKVQINRDFLIFMKGNEGANLISLTVSV